MLYPITNRSRNIISLDGEWQFRYEDEDEWRTVYVPASFNNQFTEEKARTYTGTVEYRRDFVIPRLFEKERRVLRFDAVTHNAEVYIDGKLSVTHKGGFLPFEVDITSAVNCGDSHTILVKVDNRINNHTLPVGNEFGPAFFGSDNPGIPSVENGKKKLAGSNMPNFDFFNYAGITRSVRIYTTPQEYIKDVAITTGIDGADGIVTYAIQTSVEEDAGFEVIDSEGVTVAVSKGLSGTIRIRNAHFWYPKPDVPYLYKARISCKDDEYELPFGIRTVEIRGNRFLLNGRPFRFKGFGRHEDSPVRGRGIDQCLNIKDANIFHWIGANSFRTSHYPYSEEMYFLCDREGIVIIDELPAVGMNFQGASNPYILGTREYHEELLEALIERDRNHPSVVMWSLGNEPDSEHFPEDAYGYWRPLYEKAHEIDPQNRPVTMVCCQNDYTKDITTRSMDVICINRYYGWYNLSGNLKVAKEALEEEMQFWKKIDKPLMLTEYGADAIPGFHAIAPEMFTEEYQAAYLEAMNSVMDRFSFVIGEQVWNYADFDTQQGPMRVCGNHKGVFSRDRNPKMAAYLLRKRWKERGNFFESGN